MKRVIALCSVLLFLSASVDAQEPRTDSAAAGMFRFTHLPELPRALNGAFTGYSGGAMIVAGGTFADGGGQGSSDQILLLPAGAEKWQVAATLSTGMSEGAAVTHGDALICIGGVRGGVVSSQVTRIRWRDGRIEQGELPVLPAACAGAGAAVWNGTLYVAGGRGPDGSAQSHAWALNLNVSDARWRELPAFPGSPRVQPAMAALQEGVYLFGGVEANGRHALNDNYRFTESQGWSRLADAPGGLLGMAAACGHSHILLLGGRPATDVLLAYHTITDRWVRLATLPGPVERVSVLTQGSLVTLLAGNQVLRAEAVPSKTKYGWVDHAVVAVYLVAMVGIGVYFTRRARSTNDFFRGGQRVPWWASGVSMLGASAISMMAMPAKAYATNWIYLAGTFFIILLLPIKLGVFIPMARRLNVRTANEYVERRFGLTLRMYTGSVFCLNQIISRMASVLVLPSIALSTVTGMSIESSILLMGLLTTLYTTMGGLEAVVWTDLFQTLLMIGAVLAVMVVALFTMDMGMGEAWQVVTSADKFKLFDWRLDWTMPVVWVMLASTVLGGLGAIGDQNFIQRIQCTPTEKQTRKAVITSLFVAVPFNCLLFALGTVLFLYYRSHPESLNPSMKTDGVLPLFVAQQLPIGMPGLVVAGIFAATMSTLSTGIHSVSNLGVEDFYRRLRKGASDRSCMILARSLTVLLGLLGTGAALWMARSSAMSIWDVAMTTTALIVNPIGGIFMLGLFTRRASGIGVLIGALLGMASVIWVRNYTSIIFFLYVPIGMSVCMIAGYLLSLIFPGRARDLTGLTAYTLPKSQADAETGYAAAVAAKA